MKTFGESLKAACEARGWTGYHLAAHAGMSPVRVYHIMSGTHPKPDLDTVRRLAAALGVSVGYLVDNLPVPALNARAARMLGAARSVR